MILSSGSSRYLRARVATVSSDGSITLGSESNVNGTRKVQEYTTVYDPDQEKVLIMYTDSESGYQIRTKYAYSTNQSTVSYGNNTTVTSSGTAQSLCICYNKGINKFMMGYKLSDYYRIRVGTGSSNSVSWTSETAVTNFEVNNCLIAADDTTSFICYYRCSGGSDNNKPKMTGVSVSGTTPSVGSHVLVGSQELQGSPQMYLEFNEDENKFIIISARDVVGTKMKVLSISGNTITAGSEVGFNSSSAIPYGSLEYDEDLKDLYLYYADGASGGQSHCTVQRLTISGTGIAVYTKNEFKSDSCSANSQNIGGGWGRTRAAVGPTHSLFVYKNQSGDVGEIKAVAVKTKTTNMTAGNYIGISQAAYSNGNTATIQTIGALNENQSSLTPGSKYYVQKDGTLSTTADSPSVEAGTAIAATKLIVKG